MVMGVLINEGREEPALIAEILKDHGVTLLPFHREDPEYPSLSSLGALIVMGGPQSANDGTASMERELAYVREAVKSGLPYLGVCLGLQVLVKACGGKVLKNRTPEIAFTDHEGEPYTVELTEEGKRDPLLAGLEGSLPIFHLHGETVLLGENMVTLGSGKNCEQQIVRVGDRAYGIQGHFEVTPAVFNIWRQEDSWLRACDPQKLMAQAALLLRKINKVGKHIIENFFEIALHPLVYQS
jgi:GMP synthase-like glutamine amidotransferase